jgi:hypothetical protein
MYITYINGPFGMKMTLDGKNAEMKLGVPLKHGALPGYILLWTGQDSIKDTARIIFKKDGDGWETPSASAAVTA